MRRRYTDAKPVWSCQATKVNSVLTRSEAKLGLAPIEIMRDIHFLAAKQRSGVLMDLSLPFNRSQDVSVSKLNWWNRPKICAEGLLPVIGESCWPLVVSSLFRRPCPVLSGWCRSSATDLEEYYYSWSEGNKDYTTRVLMLAHQIKRKRTDSTCYRRSCEGR